MDRARILHRYPFNSPWIRGLVRRFGLPFWFALLTLPTLYRSLTATPELFFDARLYVDATRTWLAGGDPWSAELWGNFFAAPPPTLVPLIPFALLPPDVGWVVLGLTCVAGAVLTLRLLALPWWWLLFPPLAMGLVAGNVQLLLIPLIAGGAGWAGGFFKVYGIVPDLVRGHRRPVILFGLLLVVSAPFLPWALYLESLGAINASLAVQSRYGPTMVESVLLLPFALVAMRIVGRERSAWLAVPALWPMQQWYYATFALPVRSALAAVVIALPFDWSGAAALFALAAATYWERRATRAITAGSARPESPVRTDRTA